MGESKNIKILTNSQVKHINKKDTTDTMRVTLGNKIIIFQDIIKRTILAVQKYKIIDVFGANELNICVKKLEELFSQLNTLYEPIQKNQVIDHEQYITKLQEINNDLSSLFRTFGTDNIDDLILVCFGNDFINVNFTNKSILEKYEVMKQYVHPISYKVLPWKHNPQKQTDSKSQVIKKNRIIEDFMIIESADDLECFDLARTNNSFQTKVYGIKLAIHNTKSRKTLIICGIVDDIMLNCLNYSFVEKRLECLKNNKPEYPDFNDVSFKRFLKSITLKEILIHSDTELYDRYMGYINQVYLIKQKTISQVTKEFICSELYVKRTTLIQLLLKSSENEYKYLAYLLYDLLSDDLNGKVDTQEQTILFDSLPWSIKKYFREAMKQTVNYTNDLTNFDNTKIPLEQQICLMNSNDSVKEKAMVKLKEVKSKSEDSGSKARQYLDGLMKIPFGIYKDEPILKVMAECTSLFNTFVKKINNTPFAITDFPIKEKYTSIEMRKYRSIIQNEYSDKMCGLMSEFIKQNIINAKRNKLISNIYNINLIIKNHSLNVTKICHSGKKIEYMQENISNFIDINNKNINVLMDIAEKCDINKEEYNIISTIKETFSKIDEKVNYINTFMDEVDNTLNNAVHGHEKAKRQIERIIGQWINGDKSGYCFGFEGPPGIGKTSIAKKGIANCLKDENGNSRPFAFIAVGGSSNGSTLDGHNYTYVGSTWGRIVDILMENKCMNPIIFIDELDKVSQTEHGKEIIGILTHLIDQTQNDSFQDKYFNGIDLDLSKALFIFSYNDAEAIDRILLDRIHRIKFKHLSLDEKLTITKNYLFPEIYKKMGLEDVIEINDDVIEYIIDEWTCEPGVRKLKELLFEIVGEINLAILKNNEDYEIPIKITHDDIKHKYLKGKPEINPQKIHTKANIGLISGLWANALGRGGVLPIEAKYYPCGTFLDLKLSGLQGDVMKESMTVAKTLAWSLLSKDKMKELQKEMDETKHQGIHIHVPEGATPKNGPSAGTAITVVLYSLFSNRRIRHDIAITGEMCLQGKVTGIGGLNLKILGGIKAGVKCFIFPKDNDKDFKEFMEKYENTPLIEGIEFKQVETIQEVLEIVFVD